MSFDVSHFPAKQISRLERLSALYIAGAITDLEFSTPKAAVLNSSAGTAL
jgi:hypothetical protein